MNRRDTKDNLNRYARSKIRRFDILELIAKNSKVSRSTTFAVIREKFEAPDISTTTLSGDLNLLQGLNLIEKQHHGLYRLVQSLSKVMFANTHYGERQNRHKSEKELIAQRCLDQQVDGRPLLGNKFAFICHGTSTEPLFKAFKETTPDRRPQNVVTNSLPGMLELLDYDGVRLSIMGGRPDLNCGAFRPSQLGMIGESKLGIVEFNIVVLSCSSIDSEGHIWCGDDMEAFRKAIIEQAKEKKVDIVVLADRSKLGAVPVGVPVGAKLDLNKNTWLFVDVPKETDKREQIENSEIFKGFLGEGKLDDDHFIRVPIPSEKPNK